MRILFSVFCVMIAALFLNTPAMATEYPWCRSTVDGGTNCGFSSLQQCGGGAYCYENPRYNAPTSTPSPPKRRR